MHVHIYLSKVNTVDVANLKADGLKILYKICELKFTSYSCHKFYSRYNNFE